MYRPSLLWLHPSQPRARTQWATSGRIQPGFIGTWRNLQYTTPVNHEIDLASKLDNMKCGLFASTSISHHAQLCNNSIATIKQQKTRIFQTVNHANILWNLKLRLKGIFGGCLNIRSLVSKMEQLEYFLTDS